MCLFFTWWCSGTSDGYWLLSQTWDKMARTLLWAFSLYTAQIWLSKYWSQVLGLSSTSFARALKKKSNYNEMGTLTQRCLICRMLVYTYISINCDAPVWLECVCVSTAMVMFFCLRSWLHWSSWIWNTCAQQEIKAPPPSSCLSLSSS